MIPLSRRLRERGKLFRTPSESADRQVRTFSFPGPESLVRRLEICSTMDVLNVGGGVGVLASHLDSSLNDSGVHVLAETDENYFHFTLPESLSNSRKVPGQVVDPLKASFSDNKFDRVVAYDFTRWFREDELNFFLSNIKRLLREESRVIFLETLNEDHWRPEGFRTPEKERSRMSAFRKLRSEVREKLGLNRNVSELTTILMDAGWKVNRTGGWFQPLRFNDTVWTESQRTDLLNLRYQAERDRIQRVRTLRDELGINGEDHGGLFRQLASDSQQKILRLRKALESDEETGWSGLQVLMIQASPHNS